MTYNNSAVKSARLVGTRKTTPYPIHELKINHVAPSHIYGHLKIPRHLAKKKNSNGNHLTSFEINLGS